MMFLYVKNSDLSVKVKPICELKLVKWELFKYVMINKNRGKMY